MSVIFAIFFVFWHFNSGHNAKSPPTADLALRTAERYKVSVMLFLPAIIYKESRAMIMILPTQVFARMKQCLMTPFSSNQILFLMLNRI